LGLVQRNVGSRPWGQLGSARTMPMAAEHSPVLNTERVYRVGCSKIVGQTQHDPKNEGMNDMGWKDEEFRNGRTASRQSIPLN
jgi:hypothetical protein